MGVLSSVVDLLLPQVCLACGGAVDPGSEIPLCNRCIELIERVEEGCEVCGVPWTEGGICDDCKRQRPFFDKAVAPFVYGGPIKDMILRLKYSKKSTVIRFLSESMVWALGKNGLEHIDLIVPVPTNFKKFRKRGYNPAGLLAKEEGRILEIDVVPDLLIFKGDDSQKGKTAVQRKTRRLEDFYVDEGWKLDGEIVLLVDDVMTTGATADACAIRLKEVGAKKVFVVTAARAG